MTHYRTIATPAQTEYKDRGSRFVAYAFPIAAVEDFKTGLKALKEEHPKASHHCFAYRMGTDGNAFRSGDDGEPSGTAGKPILGVIDSKGLTNVAVVVVRYFGGTLLGVPGLIAAYKTSASLVLQLTPHVEKVITVPYALEFDYTSMNDVMSLLKRYGATVESNEAMLFCKMRVAVPKSEEAVFGERAKDVYGLQVTKL